MPHWNLSSPTGSRKKHFFSKQQLPHWTQEPCICTGIFLFCKKTSSKKCRTGPCDIASKWMRIFFTLLLYSRINFFLQNSKDMSNGETGINRDIKNTMTLEIHFGKFFT
jgi:hypothetical protein